MGFAERGGWSRFVIARVMSSYATSLLDVADMLDAPNGWPEQAKELHAMAVKLEIMAGTVRRGTET